MSSPDNNFHVNTQVDIGLTPVPHFIGKSKIRSPLDLCFGGRTDRQYLYFVHLTDMTPIPESHAIGSGRPKEFRTG